MEHYKKDLLNALEAKEQAQRLACAPIAFHASKSLRDLGILTLFLENDGTISLDDLNAQLDISPYGIKVLLDMGLSSGLFTFDDNKYTLTRLGAFIEFDPMTRANMDFVADVCYSGMAHLSESIEKQQPAGLKCLGDWPTVYEGLSQLPEQAKQSWFAFDHYYSDRSFPLLLERVFSRSVKTLCDIGANTGKWTRKCCEHTSEPHITMVDLPQQLAVASKNLEEAGFKDRVTAYPCDLLDTDNTLPEGQDVYWMSQFLDCFGTEEIVTILSRVAKAMRPDSVVYILELFPDRQTYESAAHTLNATSLYFTVIANGNSRFYMSDDFLPLIDQAGLKIDNVEDNIGLGHSLVTCSLK
ncbi:class I SAM-dependent methyltransferase [Thaumasiovibrio sp. DFM-14]|uniref:class I SAM-dependent methyltransferase n=1 Tax=Thaumasiovibrio sp. DFM-14 TaxID=3384792 RepID=UPI0039A26FF5